MDTSLNIDTLHGVQPTLMGNYMLNAIQAPPSACSTKFLGVECNVTHTKHNVVDNESSLRGLDRLISKQEPPKHMMPANANNNDVHFGTNANIVDSFSPFEAVGTRTKRPTNVLSEVSIDRFEYPHESHQDITHLVFNESYRGGFQTRMNAKDCDVVQCGAQKKLKPAYGTRCFNP